MSIYKRTVCQSAGLPELWIHTDRCKTRHRIDLVDIRLPVVFPDKIPVLLAQGAEGIAVGMSTRVLPHNLIELLEAQIKYLNDESFEIYPDFPTSGLADVSGYENGNGKVLLRARLDTEDPKRIVIREVPFGPTTERLIASVEEAVRKNKNT